MNRTFFLFRRIVVISADHTCSITLQHFTYVDQREGEGEGEGRESRQKRKIIIVSTDPTYSITLQHFTYVDLRDNERGRESRRKRKRERGRNPGMKMKEKWRLIKAFLSLTYLRKFWDDPKEHVTKASQSYWS